MLAIDTAGELQGESQERGCGQVHSHECNQLHCTTQARAEHLEMRWPTGSEHGRLYIVHVS